MKLKVVTTGMNVLIADCDPIFRSLAVSRLIALEARILEAADSAEAWQHTRANRIDLALVEFEMPDFDALAFTQAMRTHSSTRHVPVIICSARAEPAAIQIAIEAGVSSFLTKPVNWPQFERHIRHLLEMGHSAAELSAQIERLEAAHLEKDFLVSGLLVALDGLTAAAHASQSVMVARQLAVLREKVDSFAQAYELSQKGLQGASCNVAEAPASARNLSAV